MRYRQIHLDFHTSEKIADIGKDFRTEQFQQMLKKGHVDSITIFSKCHHGWSYHPTKVNKMHPGLHFDLLGAQIAAAHAIDVKTPVYISAGYDEKSAVLHHDWLVYKKDVPEIDFSVPKYHKMCLNTPYLDKLLAEIKEVCENYDADGIFLDIVSVQPCYCKSCLQRMKKEWLDPENEKDVYKLAEKVYAEYTTRVRETIDSVKPGLPVFHNGGHIRHGRRDLAFADSHLELESLPTGGWGYDHFPMSAAYARTLGMEYLGMTGKFHKTWGEFGGYKHPNALRYEVALSAANGAKCSIGDQLAPCGMMDKATYSLIGTAYKTVEDREPWLKNHHNISDIAILSNEAITNYYPDGSLISSGKRNTGSDIGCSRILLEKHYLFDIIDTYSDFGSYKLIILPDNIVLDDTLAKRLTEFTQNGGKILASYKSGTSVSVDGFAIDMGCKFEGMSEYKPTYIRPNFNISCLENAAYLIYSDTAKVANTDGEVCAITENPYFNRTAEHFCSHFHTPSSGNKYSDALIIKSNTAYISHSIFSEYFDYGCIYAKEITAYAIDRLLGDDTSVKTDLGAQGIVTLTEGVGGDFVVHTLYASPVKRGQNIEIIEDIMPVYNTNVSVLSSKKPSSVTLVPENIELDFKFENSRVNFTVPKIDCWQMTQIKY